MSGAWRDHTDGFDYPEPPWKRFGNDSGSRGTRQLRKHKQIRNQYKTSRVEGKKIERFITRLVELPTSHKVTNQQGELTSHKVTNQPNSLREEGTMVNSQGKPRFKHFTKQFNSLRIEGTMVKSQGQPRLKHFTKQFKTLRIDSHKWLYEDIGRELVAKPAAPTITLVRREVQEALEKKLKRMTRHEQNLLILEKFLKVFPEGGYNGVFFSTSFPSKADVRSVEKMVMKMATKLAMVSLRDWLLDGTTFLEEVTNFNEAFEETLFKSIAKFILHTFDMEDFERFNTFHELLSDYNSWKGNFKHFKSENPYQLVAEGKVCLDLFPTLREQDIGYILQTLFTGGHSLSCVVLLMGFSLSRNACYFKKGSHDRFVAMARTVLLQYVPMEEDLKMYSILNGGVLNAIREKALSNVDKILQSDGCDENVTQSFKLFLFDLIDWKYKTLENMTFTMTFGPRFGKLGLFANEVFELVDIAELRRRFLSHRFISKHHILWAVCSTEFKDFVARLVEDIGLRDMVEKPATCPPYSVYILARATADIHGAKLVGIEHIVVATIFEMCYKRLKKNLNEFNNIPCVKIFIEDVRCHKKKFDDQKERRSSDRSCFTSGYEDLLAAYDNVDVVQDGCHELDIYGFGYVKDFKLG